jgi:hypothetical protein
VDQSNPSGGGQWHDFYAYWGVHGIKWTRTFGDSKSVVRKGVLVRLQPYELSVYGTPSGFRIAARPKNESINFFGQCVMESHKSSTLFV